MLRVVLMDNIDMMQSILSGSASMDATFLGEKNQHLNSVCFDTATHEVAFLLQERSPPSQMTMILVNMCQQLPLSAAVALNELTPRQFHGVPPLCARAPLAVPLFATAPYPQLALKCVVEHSSHYLATMHFDPEAKADGLTVEATREYSDYSAPPDSHGATISIPGLLDVVTLRLAWPVALAKYKMQRSRKRALLMCTLPKGRSLWPGDLECLPKLAAHGLSEVPSRMVLTCAIAFMFDDIESAVKKVDEGLETSPWDKVPPKDPTEAALHEVRETIQIMFVMAYKKQVQNHLLEIPGDTSNNKIQVIVHKKIRILPDGRPLLQISYVDELEVLNSKPSMDSVQQSLERFQRAHKRFVAPGLCHNRLKCTEQELAAFRDMLLRNSARTIPSKAQSEVLGLPNSEWRASSVVPLYFQRHDTKGGNIIQADANKPTIAAALNSLGLKDLQKPSAESKSDSSTGDLPNGAAKRPKKPEPKEDRKSFSRNSSGQWKRDFEKKGERMPPVTLQLVEETKQMANEDFKNGDYALAGGNYRFAMLMLERLGKPEEPAHREMLKGLHLNMAAINLKYAEGAAAVPNTAVVTRGGLDDTGFLEEVVVHCNHALEIEPTNAKALYRQAQAMVRLGLDAIAEERLQKAMMYGKAEPAMQALLKGIRSRLSLSNFERI